MTDRKIEKVFKYNLQQLASKRDSNNALYDPLVEVVSVQTYGKNVYVFTKAAIHKFQWIGDLSGHDFNMLDYDELRWKAIEDTKLQYISSVKITNGIAWISRGFTSTVLTNKFYNWDSFVRVSNSTDQILGTYTTPVQMISNFIIDNGKGWCVGTPPLDQGLTTNDINKLYIWNPANNTWASVEIPVKKQITKCQLSVGNDGYVYITNFNNFSVTRFSNITGAFDQTFRTNGYPMTVCPVPDRGVMSGSYAGMLTRINGVTGEVFNAHSTIDPALQIVAQGEEYVWFLKIADEGKIWDDEEINAQTGKDNNKGKVRVCRLTRADNEVVVFGDDVDWNVTPAMSTPIAIDVSKPFKYKQFNGTSWDEINVVPHLFVIDHDIDADTKNLYMLKLDKFVMVQHSLTMQSYSMVSTGPYDYMGEIAQGDS